MNGTDGSVLSYKVGMYTWSVERVEELVTKKPLTMWITTNCGKFLKRREYQTTWPASWEICMQVKKQ